MILFLLFTQHHKFLRNGAVYYICAVTHTLFFFIAIFVVFPGMGFISWHRAGKKKVRAAPSGAVELDEHDCRREDFHHFNNFKVVGLCSHRSTCE